MVEIIHESLNTDLYDYTLLWMHVCQIDLYYKLLKMHINICCM